ncbi:30S ribosomal protein S10 [endosymbiont DhMRE of Dentiscutata heterogama]|uniref:30S ribosomal protein S10 n=1 Tax=endosymbiont DhMRE of Dentiscutata heterogama TaxID=1609546 RepID=UPI000629DC4D|nr:30S ribosomal protein S10 [endosymbiont DhMRE of Dentiscutata heterogama]CFW92904.1 30S ribosomal protein S10 [endosymbiont DhMRE of Dentiscutata heterogama]
MNKKNNQIKITVYGYDVETTEEATRLMTEKISQLKLNFSGPIPFPLKGKWKKIVTVLISPHKHKDAQEQFAKEIHRRIIYVSDISSSALEALEKVKIPNTAHLKLETSL